MPTRSWFCVAVISTGLAAFAVSSPCAQAANQDLLSSAQQTSAAPYMMAPVSAPLGSQIYCPPLTDNGSAKRNGLLDSSLKLSATIKTGTPQKAPMIVVVDQGQHVTHVLQNQNGDLVEVFRAANTTGKKSTPTPNGRMQVADKRWDPEWKPPVSIDAQQKKVESYSKDKHNPLGVAWLGLNQGCIGLHGTNDPAKIGRCASHGCVRHRNEDIKKLYGLVPVGTPVYIVAKYTGTRLQSDDLDYLNGGMQQIMVAHAEPILTAIHM